MLRLSQGLLHWHFHRQQWFKLRKRMQKRNATAFRWQVRTTARPVPGQPVLVRQLSIIKVTLGHLYRLAIAPSMVLKKPSLNLNFQKIVKVLWKLWNAIYQQARAARTPGNVVEAALGHDPLSFQVGTSSVTTLPATAGLCLKPQHYGEILNQQPDVGWFEVHAENYLGAGGAPLYYLDKIRQHYPLSIHGVGLSIGSSDGLDVNHLERVAKLVDRFQPESFSEHLAWSTHDDQFFSDLLPLPYNRQTENIVCSHIDQVQECLGRQMLLENPSNYLRLSDSVESENEFIANVVKRTGCGLLLDVNNVYVSAHNCGYSATQYIEQFPLQSVGEIHLAGHSVDNSVASEPLLIDAHDREVCDAVWQLFAYTISRIGAVPTLIEWDANVPDWSVFYAEMNRADLLIQESIGQPSIEARV